MGKEGTDFVWGDGVAQWGTRNSCTVPRGGAAYPVDLRQPPLLPGFEQAERFPSCGRQRGGGEARRPPGPRDPSELPRVPRRAHR